MIIVSKLTARDKIDAIADLHKRAFPSFFLTQLGKPLLRTLYAGYYEDKDSGIIVAEEDIKLVGFIAYSKDYSGFYRRLIRRHFLRLGICSVGAIIRNPSIVKRLLGAFKKSGSVSRQEKYVELASICVEPSCKHNGIGSALIDYLKKIVDFAVYDYINLETDAVDNDDVNSFYIKNGFKLARVYITNEGRHMNEYRFTSGEE